MDRKDESGKLSWVLNEIEQAAQKGISSKVDGIYYDVSNPPKLPRLREEESYMEEFIGDDTGKIIEIIFHKIRTKD